MPNQRMLAKTFHNQFYANTFLHESARSIDSSLTWQHPSMRSPIDAVQIARKSSSSGPSRQTRHRLHEP